MRFGFFDIPLDMATVINSHWWYSCEARWWILSTCARDKEGAPILCNVFENRPGNGELNFLSALIYFKLYSAFGVRNVTYTRCDLKSQGTAMYPFCEHKRYSLITGSASEGKKLQQKGRDTVGWRKGAPNDSKIENENEKYRVLLIQVGAWKMLGLHRNSHISVEVWDEQHTRFLKMWFAAYRHLGGWCVFFHVSF